MKPLFLTLFASLCLGPISWADLVFPSDHVKQDANGEFETVLVEIPFTNKGPKPITISEVESSCGCISAKTDKGETGTYAMDEAGKIMATFKLGTFEGEVSKSIYVHSDDSAESRKHISVTINIPRVFEISPEVTTWKIGDEPSPKKVTLKVLGTEEIEVKSINSSRANMKAELEVVKKGREYVFSLTPEATDEPLLGALKIQTNSPKARYQNKLCFFNIVRSGPTTPAAPITRGPTPGSIQTTGPIIAAPALKPKSAPAPAPEEKK
jgi:Protein of unknown function (DUF1573)